MLVFSKEYGLWLHHFLTRHAGAGCLAMEPQFNSLHKEIEPRAHLTAFGGLSEVKGLPSSVPGIVKCLERFTLI